MFKQKTYTGTYESYVNSSSAFASIPGLTSTVTGNSSLSDLVGKKLVEFLNDCGCVDSRYDAEKHWVYIFECPFVFLVTNTTYGNAKHRSVSVYAPFGTGLFFTGTIASGTGNYTRIAPFTFVFDTSDNSYDITFRIVGEPKNAFRLIPGSYIKGTHTGTGTGFPNSYTPSTSPLFTSYMDFVKGRDLFRGFDSVAYQSGTYGICITDIDQEKNIIDTEYKVGSYYNSTAHSEINTTASQFESFGKKMFLMKVRILYFELESYVFLQNFGLSINNNIIGGTQPFFEINGDTFFIGRSNGREILPIVRCIT